MRSMQTTVHAPIGEAETEVRAALAEHGFGVLTEIDVAATLNNKLGGERPPLKILGACNPHFADEALQIDPAVALLLPCNVVLESTAAGTTVSVIDPRELMTGPEFASLAERASDQLTGALAALGPRSLPPRRVPIRPRDQAKTSASGFDPGLPRARSFWCPSLNRPGSSGAKAREDACRFAVERSTEGCAAIERCIPGPKGSRRAETPTSGRGWRRASTESRVLGPFGHWKTHRRFSGSSSR